MSDHSQQLLNIMSTFSPQEINNEEEPSGNRSGFILPSATAEILDATAVPVFQTQDQHEANLSQQQNQDNNVLVDEHGRRYQIVGDPVNRRGVFIKKVLGEGWAPCGVSKWYSCIFPVGAPLHFLCLFSCVTALCVVFSLFVVPKNEIWSIVIVAVIWSVTLVIMWRGTTTEPGIVLPARHGDIFYLDGEKQVFINEEVGKVDLKPCPFCKITRPYRASHCGYNAYCVNELDHFCSVLGIEVAQRTMRYFVGSIYGLVTLAVFCAIRSLVALIRGQNTDNGVFGMIAGWFYVILGALMTCCIVPFVGVHTYNAFLGRNQRDAVRSRKDDEHKVYGKHGSYECKFSNCWEAFCGDNGESVLENLSEEDLKTL